MGEARFLALLQAIEDAALRFTDITHMHFFTPQLVSHFSLRRGCSVLCDFSGHFTQACSLDLLSGWQGRLGAGDT